MSRFSGKKVVVTGASRGIGRAIAHAFRTEGAWVIGTRTSTRPISEDTCQEWIAADFSDMSQIRDCADRIRHDEPDVLVNNAGVNVVAPFAEIKAEDFLRIQQINVFAPFSLCQAAIPAMTKKRWGRIVNVSSIWGKISKEYRASYSASKFALDGLTLALAAEHTADGIIANSVAPGFIDTDLTRGILGDAGIRAILSGVPARRLGRVEEIASLVLWLASEENTFIAGQNIAIDGGFSRV
jgi:NAD(P)-dependent dehydrogenase (short-subunit alcohol dehydrogenase family)